jgi:DNA polymerase I-like protein with 3'-5' exonuclease and polymerase domains
MINFVSKQLIEYDGIRNSSIEECLEFLKPRKWIALDTETTGFLPHTNRLLLTQVGDYDTQFVIDCTTIDIKLLKPFLESKLILMHNAKFDWQWMYHHSVNIHHIYDTFLAEAVLTTGFDPKERHLSLKDCGNKYCNVDLDKEARGLIHKIGLTERVIQYAADDTKYLDIIRQKQLIEINKYGLNNVLDLENRFVRVLALMEYNGIRIDAKKWREVANEIEQGAIDIGLRLDEELKSQFSKMVKSYEQSKIKLPQNLARIRELGKFVYDGFQYDIFNTEPTTKINWASPTQKLALLKTLGVSVKSTDSRELTKNRVQNPIIPILLEYGKQEKLVTSFGNEFVNQYINPTTQLVHPNYFQIVSTGRISCSNPNLLNIPSQGPYAKRIRSSFVAKPGYKIVGGDYSNFELRIIAEFSKDPLWLKVFNEGGDLHAELCCRTFNISVEDIHKAFPLKPVSTYRAVQKTIDFMLAYGGSEHKLADMLDTTVPKAKEIINNFFAIIPAVKNTLDMFALGAQQFGYIRTAPPFRRIRWFPKLHTTTEETHYKILGEIGREAKNTPIQGTNGDVTKLAMCMLQDEIDTYNYPMQIILAVYDEIQTECLDSFTEQGKSILERIMITAAQTVLKIVPIKVDVKINDYWTK